MATSTLPPHPETLASILAPVARRLTWARWTHLASRGALVGMALCFVLVALSRFGRLPETFPLIFVLAVVLLVGAGSGTVLALARPATVLQAARRAEAHGELKERLSSALALQEQSSATVLHSELLRLQQEDALAYARQIDPVQTVPLRWPPEAKWLLAALTLLALLLWLPNLPVFLSPSERLERATVQKAGEKLIRQGRLVEQQGASQHLDQTRRAGRLMQKMGQRMAAGHMDKRQALAQSASLSQQLADAQRQAAGPVPLSEQQMRQLAKQSAGQSPAQAKQTAGQAQKIADEAPSSAPQTKAHAQAAADALKRGDPSAAAKELDKAADAAKREARAQGQKPPTGGQSQSQQDAQGVQNAQKSVEDERQEVARASGPQDISNPPSSPSQGQNQQTQNQQTQNQQTSRQGEGQKSSSGQPQSGPGKQPGAEQGTKSGGKSGLPDEQGQSPNGKPGNGRQPAPGENGRPAPGGSGKVNSAPKPGQEASGQPGMEHGPGATSPKAPLSLNPKFIPSANPGYGRVYLGDAAGRGKTVQSAPGQAQAQSSTVPIASVAPQFRKGAEAAMDREDVPPTYRDGVRNYFNNLGSNNLGSSPGSGK